MFNYSIFLFNIVLPKNDKMTKIDFNEKFYAHTSSLNAFAYNLTKNGEDANDLYQETAIRAFKNIEKFKPGTNLKAWLFTIMKNIFINNYRKKMKRNTLIDTTDNMYFINSGSSIVENKADGNMAMEELSSIIESIDVTLSQPFLLHYQGFKYQEIADQLQLPLGTVKSRIFFARKELQQKILSSYGDYETAKSKLSVA